MTKIIGEKVVRFEGNTLGETMLFCSTFTLKHGIYNLNPDILVKKNKETGKWYADFFGEHYSKAKDEMV